MEEIWKNVEGYEGLYQVSNLGRVKSLNYNHTGNERILRPGKVRSGYLIARLCKEGKMNGFSIHRLVAQAFIPNHYNLPEVNHIDENKENNCVENLEWCTREYNCSYGTSAKRISYKNRNHPSLSKKVLCAETRVVYPSTQEASRQTGIIQGSISQCCNGKRNTAGGYHWKYIE